jgi:hypothetical protein
MNILRSLIRETLLLEEVYGAQATVYHGTNSDAQSLISAILNDEFTPGIGSGHLYGKGLYTVYEPEGSSTIKGAYGSWVIKFKVNLYGYIIFDSDIALKVYGSALTPAEQAQKLRYSSITIRALKGLSKESLSAHFTADAALQVFESIQNEVKGLIFTGKNDGRVAVIYDPTTVIPVAWKKLGGEFKQVGETWDYIKEKWQTADRTQAGFKSAVKRSATGEYEEGKYDEGSVKLLRSLSNLPLDKRVVDSDLYLAFSGVTSIPKGLKVSGDLNLTSTQIKYLPAGLQVGGNLTVGATLITSLPAGLQVGGSLSLVGTSITSLPPDLKVGRSMFFSRSKISSLPAGLKVGGELSLNFTPITSLPAGLQTVSNLSLVGTPITSLPAGLKVGLQLVISDTNITSLPQDLVVGGKILGLDPKYHGSVPEHLMHKIAGLDPKYHDSVPRHLRHHIS